MKEYLKKRMNNRAGFTLGETLMAILILLMVTGVIAGAIPAASNAYTKTVDAANAQVLLSTAMTVLREELSTATDVSVSDSVITYNGGKRVIKYETSADPKVPSGIYITYERETGGSEKRLLVSEAASTKGMIVNFKSVTVGTDTITFTGLTVTKDAYKDGSGKLVYLAGSETDTYVIRKVS